MGLLIKKITILCVLFLLLLITATSFDAKPAPRFIDNGDNTVTDTKQCNGRWPFGPDQD